MMTAPTVPTACVMAYDGSSGTIQPVKRAAVSVCDTPQLTKKQTLMVPMRRQMTASR